MQLAPFGSEINISIAPEYFLTSPLTFTWRSLENLRSRLVSKADYEEMGSDYMDVRAA